MRGVQLVRSDNWRLQMCSALGIAMLAIASNQANGQGFTGVDIGGVSAAGSAVTNPDGTITIKGSGSDIWGTFDNFFYYYKPVTGQYWDATVRVQSFTRWNNDGGGWSKCELMVRNPDVASGIETPDGGDPFIANMTTGTTGVNRIEGQYRGTRNGNAGEWTISPFPAPPYPNTWLKLSRVGPVFTIAWGTDGLNWTQIGRQDTSTTANGFDGVAWPDKVLVGIAVTAHSSDADSLATAVVSDLKVTPLAGLFIGQPVGLPDGFTIQIGDNGATIANPATATFTLNGTTVTANAQPKVGAFTTFINVDHTKLLPPGQTNTVVINIKDGSGATTTATRTFVTAKYFTIPASAALPAASVDKTVPGFKLRIHQVDRTDTLPNSDSRTELQLGGGYGANVANTSTYIKGYMVEPTTINYNDAQNSDATSTNVNGNFGPDRPWPSINSVNTNNFVAEIWTVLEFPRAGAYGMIVNSDDGFKVGAYIPGTDVKTNVVGIFEGGRGSADTLFYVNVAAPGLYAFRLTYEQGGGGADLEWMTVNDTGKKILINSNDPEALKAYAKADAILQKPYFEVALPGGGTEPNNVTVEAVIVDADTTVAPGTVTMKFDGAAVAGTVSTPSAGKTRIVYTPPALVASSQHTVQVDYKDSTGASLSKVWNFQVAGAITMRYFALGTSSDGSVGGLTGSADYKANAPTIVSNAPTIEINDGSGGWGVEYLGYFAPLVSANYTFYISADDNAQLWLSTDDNPGNAVQIANEPSWSNYREWLTREGGGIPDGSAKRSAPIALEQGKRYFIRALAKQGGGGGNLAVTWWKPGDPPIVGGDPAKSAGLVPLTDPAVGVKPTIINVVQGRRFQINGAVAVVEGTTTYQWLKGGSPISGATDVNYVVKSAAVSDSGNYTLRVTVAPPTGGTKTATSSPSVVTVSPDTAAPVPEVGAIKNADGNGVEIGVSFGDDLVDAASLVQANFTVTGATVTGFRVVTNSYNTYKAVQLKVTGLAEGGTASVTVNGVKDIFGNTTAATTKQVTLGNTGWAEVGTPIAKGAVIPVGSNGFDIVSGGRGYWGNYDEIDMAYVQKTGDFDVAVQIVDAEFASQWARAGFAVRNDLNIGMARPADGNEVSTASAYAEIHANPNQTIAATWDPNDPVQVANPNANNSFESNQRVSTGAQTSGWQTGPAVAPTYPNVWLRLKRTGTNIVSFRSLDGQTWIQMGSTSITPFQPTVYVGPAWGPEVGNFWGANFDVWGSPYDPQYDRLMVTKYRNFGDTPTAAARATMTVTRNGNQLTLSWDKAGTLESSTQVGAGATWAPVTGVTGNSYTAPIGTGNLFYRVKAQ